MEETRIMQQRDRQARDGQWNTIPSGKRQTYPKASKTGELPEGPWCCRRCQTWHRNPLCINCREFGMQRPEIAMHAPPPIPTQRFRPWERRERAKEEAKTAHVDSGKKGQQAEETKPNVTPEPPDLAPDFVPKKCKAVGPSRALEVLLLDAAGKSLADGEAGAQASESSEAARKRAAAVRLLEEAGDTELAAQIEGKNQKSGPKKEEVDDVALLKEIDRYVEATKLKMQAADDRAALLLQQAEAAKHAAAARREELEVAEKARQKLITKLQGPGEREMTEPVPDQVRSAIRRMGEIVAGEGEADKQVLGQLLNQLMACLAVLPKPRSDSQCTKRRRGLRARREGSASMSPRRRAWEDAGDSDASETAGMQE